jgi:hypothetical protein
VAVGPCGRQEPAQVRFDDGVVDDHQPPAQALPGAEQVDRRVGRRHGLARHRDTQVLGQLGQCGHGRRGLFGGHPPHQVVVGGVPIGVLGRQLGLADAAEPVHGLRHAGGELRTKRRELDLPADEVRVPRPRHPPDRGRARQRRFTPRRERGLVRGLAPISIGHPQQPGLRRRPVDPEQVHRHDLPQEPVADPVLHPDDQ